MTPDELYRYLLTPQGMADARRALLGRFHAFVHVSSFAAINDIRRDGLRPNWPGGAPPNAVYDAIGDSAVSILCLRPLGSSEVIVSKDPPLCTLAVLGNDLPNRIGLDWSFDGCWSLAHIILETGQGRSPGDIFVEVATRRGSVVAYDGVPAPLLRVCPLSAPDSDPSVWPPLKSTPNDQIARL